MTTVVDSTDDEVTVSFMGQILWLLSFLIIWQARLYEIFVHQQLRHPNIVLFIGAVIRCALMFDVFLHSIALLCRGPRVILVTEFAACGSLWNLLHERCACHDLDCLAFATIFQ